MRRGFSYIVGCYRLPNLNPSGRGYSEHLLYVCLSPTISITFLIVGYIFPPYFTINLLMNLYMRALGLFPFEIQHHFILVAISLISSSPFRSEKKTSISRIKVKRKEGERRTAAVSCDSRELEQSASTTMEMGDFDVEEKRNRCGASPSYIGATKRD